MSASTLSAVDDLLLRFSLFDSSVCRRVHDEWSCDSISRIAFALDLLNLFGISVVAPGQLEESLPTMLSALQYLLHPFQVRDLRNDLIHVAIRHFNDNDMKYLNNGVAIPRCEEHTQCQVLLFRESQSDDDRDAWIDFFILIHRLFAHCVCAGARATVQPLWTSAYHLRLQHSSASYSDAAGSFELFLRSINSEQMKLLFNSVQRRLSYKQAEADKICADILQKLPGKIDETHDVLPSLTNIIDIEEHFSATSEQHECKQSILDGTLSPQTLAECTEEHCDFLQCPCFKRVLFMMQQYHKFIDKQQDEDEDDEEEDDEADAYAGQLLSLLLSGAYSAAIDFIDDFNHIRDNHLLISSRSYAWQYLGDELGECQACDSCLIARRNSRDRMHCDCNAAERKKVYFGLYDTKDVLPYHILDSVHHFLMHSNWEQNVFPDPAAVELNSSANTTNECDSSSANTTNNCESKPAVCTPSTISTRTRNDRFVSAMGEHPKLFGFGKLFCHWNAPGYKGRDGYIDRKSYRYRNLKEEMLRNTLCALSLDQWNDSVAKAIIFTHCRRGKALTANNYSDYNFNRGIPKNLPISVSHFAVILIYTNYSKPQQEFKRKGMRLSHVHDNQSILNRNHREICNFYKLFHETVFFYGTLTKSGASATTEFYHGINTDQLFFSEFHPKFNVPISATPRKDIARSFFDQDSEQGMLLVLKCDQMTTDRFFDCSWCSEHRHEEERLFAYAHTMLITNIELKRDPLGTSYSKYIMAMSLLTDVFSAKYFMYSMPDCKQHESVLVCLLNWHARAHANVEESGQDTDPDGEHEAIPDYIARCFENVYQIWTRKNIEIVESEFVKLQPATKAALRSHFGIAAPDKMQYVQEFAWTVSHVPDPKSQKSKIISSKLCSFGNKLFTFTMYLKLRSHIKADRITVGICIEDIFLDAQEIEIEWGYKVDEMQFCMSNLREVLREGAADAYKAFATSLITDRGIKQLHFTFYVKMLRMITSDVVDEGKEPRSLYSCDTSLQDVLQHTTVDIQKENGGLFVIAASFRLQVRSVQLDDIDFYQEELWGSPAVMKFFGSGKVRLFWEDIETSGVNYAKNRIGVWRKRWDSNDPFSGFTVIETTSQKRCGHVVVGGGELAFLFSKDFWGKGYGTESVAILLYCIIPTLIRNGYQMPKRKIYATVIPDHQASQNLLAKCGMQTDKNINLAKFGNHTYHRYVFQIPIADLVDKFNSVRHDGAS